MGKTSSKCSLLKYHFCHIKRQSDTDKSVKINSLLQSQHFKIMTRLFLQGLRLSQSLNDSIYKHHKYNDNQFIVSIIQKCKKKAERKTWIKCYVMVHRGYLNPYLVGKRAGKVHTSLVKRPDHVVCVSRANHWQIQDRQTCSISLSLGWSGWGRGGSYGWTPQIKKMKHITSHSLPRTYILKFSWGGCPLCFQSIASFQSFDRCKSCFKCVR